MTKCVIPHPYTGINRWEQNGGTVEDMDDEKWKKAVDKTEEVVFGYCALRENRKARKASRKARYRSLKQQKGRVRALLHMVGEGIIFGIVYGIFWLIAGVMALRLKWLGERREKRYDSWQDN